MTQRNPMNDRYTDENRTGKTRKSSASVKPKTERAATVREAAPKSKEQKKKERKERERKEAEKAQSLNGRYEQTEGYKTLRRIWWVCLGGAIALTAASFALNGKEELQSVSMAVMVAAYALIIVAFYIDLGKIRKERKLYNASIANSNTKEARREQKRMRAEQREMEKEAAEKYEAAKAEEEAKKAEGGFFSRFLKKDKSQDDQSGEAQDESEK
ncbi:MAG: hypothetical protein J5818_01160 [Eggerthellaceae bacterium]|nr:hypothetical protein [Eggerthellaceae bacterium]